MSTAYLQYSRKTAAILVVLAMVLALFPMAAFASHGQFTDVSGTLADEILAAHNAGLVDGYEDGSFRPNENVTRAAFAKMVVLALEKASGQELQGGSEPFSDVNPSQALYSYVVKAYNAKLINGYADGTFGYNKPINRQEAAAILQRALKLADAAESFADVPDNSAFAKAIGAVAAAGIMNGYNSTTFGPADNITRGQAAATAYRAYDYAQPFKVASISLVNARQLKITFTKAVDAKTVIGYDKTLADDVFEFKSLDGHPVTANEAAAELSGDGKVLTITPKSGTTQDGDEYFQGRYAVSIANTVKSTSGASLPAYSAVLDLTDTVRPTVTAAEVNVTGQVTLTFSEPVKGAKNTGAYAVTLEGASKTISGLDYVPDTDYTKVRFTIDGAEPGKTYSVTINGTVTDYAGNLISPNPTVKNVQVPEDSGKPSVTSITGVDRDEFKVTFSEPIKDLATANDAKDDFVVKVDGASVTPASVTWNSTRTVATVDIGIPYSKDETHQVEISGFEDLAGNKGDKYSAFVYFKADLTAPKVKSASVETIQGKAYVVIRFDEPVALATSPAGDLTGSYIADGVLHENVTIPGSAVSVYDPDEDNQTDALRIDIAGAGMAAGDWTIELTAGYVVDLADDGLTGQPNQNAVTTVQVTIGASGDTTKPAVAADANDFDNDTNTAEDAVFVQRLNNNTVEVIFTERVTDATALNVNNYTVEGNAVFTKAVFLDAAKKTVRLTLKDGAITASGPMTFRIENIADLAGNVMKPYEKVFNFKENVAPKLVSAKLTGINTVVLTFSENIANLDVNDFANVTVAGATGSVSGVQVSGNTATVTFTPSLTKSGDTFKATIKAGVYADAAGTRPQRRLRSACLEMIGLAEPSYVPVGWARV
ncbi:S-layer homology domain-containing protein [Thermaerobacter subterraneus]|uniref:S-layer domain containing protein n=1 Tax=Thermaerobacter subterraneus DSM 13965 TaxID=867903 RepID=K6PZG1_9FIRM|nr:S-layer homology domain-containing protein [Thermaerobacter subterraneus]EKP94183.1 S-layer domain containing protein [Thermaerobacter subterraneus DSM 13965]